MAGPGTARKVEYFEVEVPEKKSSLVVVETGAKRKKARRTYSEVMAMFRLVLVMLLVGTGIVLVATLSSYLYMFHAVKAEVSQGGTSLYGIVKMQQYAEQINVYDIANSYYHVPVKVER